MWDEQLDRLRERGAIPQVDADIQKKLADGKALTKEERKDPGLVAQAEIFETMYTISQQRETQGLPPIADAIHIYHEYISPKKKKPAGASAPVSGGKKAVDTGKQDDMSYEELHNATFEDILGIG